MCVGMIGLAKKEKKVEGKRQKRRERIFGGMVLGMCVVKKQASNSLFVVVINFTFDRCN